MDHRDGSIAAVAEMRRLLTQNANMVAGEIWHPVDARWAAHWLAHIGMSQKNASQEFSPAPGPVDNLKLQGSYDSALYSRPGIRL